MSSPDHDLGRPTIIEINDPIAGLYRISGAVQGLGPDRRIVGIEAKDNKAILVTEPMEPGSSRYTLKTSIPTQQTDQAPITRPYALFDSWNPDK